MRTVSRFGIKVLASSVSFFSVCAFADVKSLSGSDTLYGAMSDAIIQAGLESELQYVGGGSGAGEKAMVAGTQALAGSSRPFKPEAIAQAKAAGIEITGTVIAVDGIAVWANKANPTVRIDMESLKKVFTCAITTWEQVPGSTQTGAIKVYRRNDASGTTDLFKSNLKLEKFGDCVSVLEETADIAAVTAKDPAAIAYAGLSAGRANNKPLQLSKDATSTSYLPIVANIRPGYYPLSRNLYVYSSNKLSAPEAALLEKLQDRSFMDPIVQANEFFTID